MRQQNRRPVQNRRRPSRVDDDEISVISDTNNSNMQDDLSDRQQLSEQSMLYQQAADLLSRVNSALTNDNTHSIGTLNAMPIDYTLAHPGNVNLTETIPRRMENLTLDNEVQLILDGIPEIQFGDDTVSDDLVDHLLKLGGKPPSQLQLPTAQMNQHEVLKTLQDVVKLRVSLKNMSIFSARYGVRKEGSFLVVKTPTYYEVSLGNNPYHVSPNADLGDHLPQNIGKSPKTIPFIRRNGEEKKFLLKELEALEDTNKPVILRRNDKKDSIKKFFLGDCDLTHVLLANIFVSDRLLQDWMRNENLIEIQLYGYVPPPGTLQKGVSVGPTCFARAHINPINLLTCPELDAMVNVDLVADKATLSDVTSRMQLLLAGTRVKPLSDRMGVLSVRLSLLREKNSEGEGQEGLGHHASAEEKSYEQPVRTIPHEIMLPHTVQTQPVFHAPEDSALQYAPHQAPETQETTQFLTNHSAEELRNALHRQPKPLPAKEVFLGIAAFAMSGDIVRMLRHILKQHTIPHEDDCLFVRFKVSKHRSDCLRIPLTHCQLATDRPNAMIMPVGKLCAMAARLQAPPFLEIWVELMETQNSPDSEHQQLIPAKHLLAWTSRKTPVLFHQLSDIMLVDPGSLQACGHLHAVFYQHEYPYFIEEKLQQQLDVFELPPLPTASTTSSEIPKDNGKNTPSLNKKDEEHQKPVPSVGNADVDVVDVDSDTSYPDVQYYRKDHDDSLHNNISHRKEDDNSPDANKQEELQQPRSRALSNVSDDSLGDSSGDKSKLFAKSGNDNNNSTINEDYNGDIQTDTSSIPREGTTVHATSALHFAEQFVLDVVPHGICSVFGTDIPSSATPATSLSMGCFVCYSLPALKQQQPLPLTQASHVSHHDSSNNTNDNTLMTTAGSRVVHFPHHSSMRAEQQMFSLWWDADCAILNGRNRHSFTLTPPAPHVPATVHELAASLGIAAHVGWEFFIVGSDIDGNLLSEETYVSRGVLPLQQVLDCLNHASLHEDILTISLTPNPLHLTASQKHSSRLPAEMIQMIPVELRLRLSWRREPILRTSATALPKPMTDSAHVDDKSAMVAPVIHKKEQQYQPLSLTKALPYSFHQEFCLPSYQVTVLAFHHLKTKPYDLLSSSTPSSSSSSSSSHNNTTNSPPSELLYSIQHAGDVATTSTTAIASSLHKIVDKIAYPENFRVISSTFSSAQSQPHNTSPCTTNGATRLAVQQKHLVHTPVRRSSLLSTVNTSVRNPQQKDTEHEEEVKMIDQFVHTFSALGALTLTLFERHSLFPTHTHTHPNYHNHGSNYTDNLSHNNVPRLIQATDVLLGTAAIDLDVLLHGLTRIEGWYNLVDSVQSVVGQVLLRVEPVAVDNSNNNNNNNSSDGDGINGLYFNDHATLLNNPPYRDNHMSHNDSALMFHDSRLVPEKEELFLLDYITTDDRDYEHLANNRNNDKVVEEEIAEEEVSYEPLLDITGMEKDALTHMLAELEASKKHLLATFGYKPLTETTLSNPNTATDLHFPSHNLVQQQTNNNSNTHDESLNSSEYSSDFESLLTATTSTQQSQPPAVPPVNNNSATNNYAKNDWKLNNVQTTSKNGHHQNQSDLMKNFTADLEGLASPVLAKPPPFMEFESPTLAPLSPSTHNDIDDGNNNNSTYSDNSNTTFSNTKEENGSSSSNHAYEDYSDGKEEEERYNDPNEDYDSDPFEDDYKVDKNSVKDSEEESKDMHYYDISEEEVDDDDDIFDSRADASNDKNATSDDTHETNNNDSYGDEKSEESGGVDEVELTRNAASAVVPSHHSDHDHDDLVYHTHDHDNTASADNSHLKIEETTVSLSSSAASSMHLDSVLDLLQTHHNNNNVDANHTNSSYAASALNNNDHTALNGNNEATKNNNSDDASSHDSLVLEKHENGDDLNNTNASPSNDNNHRDIVQNVGNDIADGLPILCPQYAIIDNSNTSKSNNNGSNSSDDGSRDFGVAKEWQDSATSPIRVISPTNTTANTPHDALPMTVTNSDIPREEQNNSIIHNNYNSSSSSSNNNYSKPIDWTRIKLSEVAVAAPMNSNTTSNNNSNNSVSSNNPEKKNDVPSSSQAAHLPSLEGLLPAQVLRRILPSSHHHKPKLHNNNTGNVSSSDKLMHDMSQQSKQRRKMDEETERIARIMRGVLNHNK